MTIRDAPREALRRAFQAAQKLDALGAPDEAFPGFRSVVNSVGEVPLHSPYSHYSLGDATVIARQPQSDSANDAAVGGQPATRPLTVIGTYDITGIIDDDGRGVGRPIGSGDVDRSYANDAAWLDDGNFILATGEWSTNGPSEPYYLLNPALRRYRADGTLAEEYLAGHMAPVTSVAVLRNKKKPVILAGDAFGNLIVKPVGGELKIIPTGIRAPIKRIVIEDSSQNNVVVVFGHSAAAVLPGPTEASSLPVLPDREDHVEPSTHYSPPLAKGKNLNISDQLKKILAALELPASVSYLGDNPADEIGCAIVFDVQLYVCNRNTIDVWKFKQQGGLEDKPDGSFPAQNASVTAIAASPRSPIIAAGYADGQIRLWLKDGTLLTDLVKDEQTDRVSDEGREIGALGFVHDGLRLLSSSPLHLHTWDIEDISLQIKTTAGSDNANWIITDWTRRNWANFSDQTSGPSDPSLLERLKALIAANSDNKTEWTPHGRFIIAASSADLHLIDMQNGGERDVDLDKTATGIENSDSGNTNTDRPMISVGASTTICVLYGDQNSDTRRLYAINEEKGAVLAEWPLPAEWKKDSNISLAVQFAAGETTCWAAAGQSIVVFSPSDGLSRTIKLDNLEPTKSGSISRILPVDNSNLFLFFAGQNLALARVEPASVGGNASDVNAAGGTPIRASVVSSIKLKLVVSRIAISSDGSRIAIAIEKDSPVERGNDGEIRLFDQRFNTLVSLPGIPESFGEFHLSPDGKTLRGTTWSGGEFEQDLRLQSLLDRARGRLVGWVDDDDRVTLYNRGVEEKDWEKGRLILQNAAARHPSDIGINLLLANREFYTAKNLDDRKRAMNLYDRTNALDPFEPISHYMRGRARAILADYKNAIDDFSDAIELPHILPAVKVIAGFLGINQGIAKLSYQLNLQSKSELYLRRASARIAIGDWQGVIEDVGWLRENHGVSAQGYELEALALHNLGNSSAAITSYQRAAAILKDAKSYGPFEELKNYINENARRNFKIAFYNKRIGDLFQRTGRNDEAAAAYASAQKQIVAAYALPDVTVQAHAQLDQLLDQPPKRRCDDESRYKSIEGVQAMPITFFNNYTSSVRVYWLDYAGQRKLYANIDLGGSYRQLTYLTHPWLISDPNDHCIAIYLPGEQPSQINIQRIRLGIVMVDISPEMESSLQLPTKEGAVIKEFAEPSPAADAGASVGDIIVKINDIPIRSAKDVVDAVRLSGPAAVIQVLRNGARLTLRAVLEN